MIFRPVYSPIMKALFSAGVSHKNADNSRFFSTLTSGLGAYWKFAKTLEFQAGDTYEFWFLAPTSSVSDTEYLFDGDINDSTRAHLILNTSGSFVTSGGITYTVDGQAVTLYPTDGRLHKVVVTFTGHRRVGVLGVRQGKGFGFYNGIFADTVSTISGVKQSYTLGKGKAEDYFTYGGELWGDRSSVGTTVTESNTYSTMFSVSNSLVIGRMYAVEVDVSTDNAIQIAVAGVTKPLADGINSFIIEAASIYDLQQITSKGSGTVPVTATLNNVSVKEITNYSEILATVDTEYCAENVFGVCINNPDAIVTSAWSAGAEGAFTQTGTDSGKLELISRAVPSEELWELSFTAKTLSGTQTNKLYSYAASYAYVEGYNLLLVRLPVSNGGRQLWFDGTSDGAVVELTNTQWRKVSGNAIKRENVPPASIKEMEFIGGRYIGGDTFNPANASTFADESQILGLNDYRIYSSSGVNSGINVVDTLTVGDMFIVSGEIYDYQYGAVSIGDFNHTSATLSADGEFSEVLTAQATGLQLKRYGVASDLKVRNLKVRRKIEVAQ